MLQSLIALFAIYNVIDCRTPYNNRPMDFKTLYDRDNMMRVSKALTNYKANITGIEFATPFTTNAVLQREPHIAAVYGMSPIANANTQIKLTLTNEANGESEQLTTNSMKNGDWKILLKKTYSNGGNYTITVSCAACGNTQQTIHNVTFGDVFICTGQSNMWLPMEHTFNRNYTYANMSKFGKYTNIRFITPIDSHQVVISDENASFTRQIQNGPTGLWAQSYQIDMLQQFSGACWYFAQTLQDKYNLANITFGLINTALGGSVIESWAPNNTIWNFNTKSNAWCNSLNVNITPDYGWGCLYNGLVIPFINYTVKGQLWYQGENDVGHYESGNVLNKTGYACIEQLMIKQWRANWSVVANTSDPDFGFGVVALAAGTTEAHEGASGDFRWAQSLNYGIMPNPAITNTFMVQGYDIGDPWNGGCPNHGICNTTSAPYSTLLTPQVMGNLHCRDKEYIGHRYAMGASKVIYGNDHIYSGPIISGCSVNNKMITISFNKTLLYDEKVIVQEWAPWYNVSIPLPPRWSATQVLVNKTKWYWINDEYGLSTGSDGYSVIVNITEFDGSIDGIRYAWGDITNSALCCGTMNTQIQPCPMASCPIVSSESLLPASPINAMIQNNKCVCYAPQQC
eukprot:434642_1